MTITILHVVESYGGGVAAAVADYARATPEYTHHLLAAVRAGAEVATDAELVFSRIERLKEGHLARVRQVRAARRAAGPCVVVHAHSSFAGIYVRLGLRSRRTPVVYTPHCFAFLREDVPKFVRLAYRAAEWALARNTSLLLGCSLQEAGLGRRLGVRRSVYVPNTLSAGLEMLRSTTVDDHPSRALRLIAIGRLSPQKDPDFFAELVRKLAASGETVEAVWVGDGSGEYRARLERAGIAVTGWLAREDVLEQLQAADIYVHTARWEGFPISVLEAANVGLPIFAREIGAFEGTRVALQFRTTDELVRSWARVTGSTSMSLLRQASLELLEDHSPSKQRASLSTAYRSLTPCAAQEEE